MEHEVMGKCADCGFSAPRTDSKGSYRLRCLNNGTCKRHGDSCSAFWDKDEMKEFIDKTIPLVADK